MIKKRQPSRKSSKAKIGNSQMASEHFKIFNLISDQENLSWNNSDTHFHNPQRI